MRYDKIALLILVLFSFGSANHISWLGEYDKALQQAQEEDKPIMILLVKKDCKRCNEIIVKNFMNHKYIDKFNEKYISVIVTYEGRTSYPIEMFYSRTFPTLFFINSRDESFLREPIYGEEISMFFELIKNHDINDIISKEEQNIIFKRLEIYGKEKEKTVDKDKQ